jgi:hypothetical protein
MNDPIKRSQVKAEIAKNRLYIILKGTVSAKELESIYTDIRFCIADLKSGFSVITDLTEGKIGHLSGIMTFKKIADYLVSQKVGTVVRVVGKPSVLSNQISRLTEIVQGYRPIYVATMEEAEEALKKSE